MKKNTNSKKAQEYILDLTDFTVDGSDYAGSYGNFSKFFEDDLEAIRFQQEVMNYIDKHKKELGLGDSATRTLKRNIGNNGGKNLTPQQRNILDKVETEIKSMGSRAVIPQPTSQNTPKLSICVTLQPIISPGVSVYM